MKRKLTADEAVRILQETGAFERLTQDKFEDALYAAFDDQPCPRIIDEWDRAPLFSEMRDK